MLTVLRYPQKQQFTSACRAATGRSLVLHMARRWATTKVFMPCYVPDGIINPFRAQDAEIIFYRLRPNLLPDLAHVAFQLDAHADGRSILVGIRYFGFSCEAEEMAYQARRFDALAFVDCAHCLPGTIQTDGDAVLFSLNKFLPVTDGAILGSRRDDLNVEAHGLPALEQSIVYSYEAHLAANREIAVAQSEHSIADAAAISESAYNDYYSQISLNMELREQTPASRAMEATTDFIGLARRRAERALILRELLSQAVQIRNENAQFAFPIKCRGKREEMIAALSSIGVMPSALDYRWDHVQAGFDVEAEFCADHLLLPLHDGVSKDSLATMAWAVNQVAGGQC